MFIGYKYRMLPCNFWEQVHSPEVKMWLQKAATGHPNTSEDVLHSSTFMPSQWVDSACKRERRNRGRLERGCSARFGSTPFNSNRLPAIPGGPQAMAEVHVLLRDCQAEKVDDVLSLGLKVCGFDARSSESR